MNRRDFLKYLSSIPLIGIPVKLLAKTPEVKKYGEYVQAGFDNVPQKVGCSSITPIPEWVKVGDHVDPYDEWIPAKPPETVRYGKTEFFDSEEELVERITGQPNHTFKDPYADVAEHVYKAYWNDSAEMNTDFGKITLNRGVTWLD